ncbi:hypothetical protein J1C52_00090 [Roseibaca sp. Y0-43]|nr:hypothetical protein [Roseibaca sp. Y0-43]
MRCARSGKTRGSSAAHFPCPCLIRAGIEPDKSMITRAQQFKERTEMPYDTHNRWVHGVLAEAAKTIPDLPWSRQAKQAKRAAAEKLNFTSDCPAYREQAFYE